MIVRALDNLNDWRFGNGLNDYASNIDAVAFDLEMNLSMFLGDCFFATNVGIDWFNLLGGKNLGALNLAINGAILNTVGVTSLLQTSINLDPVTRRLSVNYKVQTVYSVLQGTFIYSAGGT